MQLSSGSLFASFYGTGFASAAGPPFQGGWTGGRGHPSHMVVGPGLSFFSGTRRFCQAPRPGFLLAGLVCPQV
jgi:hypothetical protein